MPTVIVKIEYTNHRGERRTRRIVPQPPIVFKSTYYHSTAQWILRALDVEKNELRDFAMANIHSWAPDDNR